MKNPWKSWRKPLMVCNYDDYHKPVMLDEVIEHLAPRPDGIYVDCTLGAGGHSERILELSSPTGVVIGIDRDEKALELARERLSRFGDRFLAVHGNFAAVGEIVHEHGLKVVDGVLMDLGVSSMQLDAPQRGFSFLTDAPLDMRMDTSQRLTACDVVNSESEQELSRILWEFGEERWSRRIARAIVRAREKRRITTTGELVEIVVSSVPRRRSRIHPATRTFQALRIYVNRELDNLDKGLDSSIDILGKHGRICVISFHSLEDRIVKWKFRSMAETRLRIITKKPLTPTPEEIDRNPRSRSAKLRVAEAL